MRWPIRNQILLPFVAIQVLAIGAIAAATSWIAVRSDEKSIETQLSNVVTALEGASFPLTSRVLRQLQSLSGAHFVLLDQQQSVVETTLSQLPSGGAEFSGPLWKALDRDVVGDRTPLEIAGQRYFAGSVRWIDSRGGGRVLVLYPHTEWRSARWKAMSPPLVIGGLLLLATVSVSVVLSRRIGRRMDRVQLQVARIAGGDFRPIEAAPLDDELRDLSSGVNRMAAALAESLQRVRETERSTLLTQLVGGLAHQLRNAITGARISVQLHQRRCRTRDDEALDVALQQLRLTEEQLKALLRVTRGEARTPARGDVSEILDATIALVRPICEHHQITLTTRVTGTVRMIEDADAMRAALLNLMMNAIEAAGPHGEIRIEAQGLDEQLKIAIADNGPGYAEHQDIFQEFYSTKREGVGLGLSLARQAVEDCGGVLDARRLGGWTIFEISLSVPVEKSSRQDNQQSDRSGLVPAEIP